ncbi:MAG TPA: ABC transporter substrate-binding protein [Chloroflexota bacterium]|jgi:4,5-dihydroxyphthalate decarboxylase
MKLKMAFHKNPRIIPLVDGTVPLEGHEMDWHVGSAAELFRWHLTENACDVFEFSISEYIITKDEIRRGQRTHLRWLAIPMFLMKAAMWLEFYVHADSGIKSFADLKGKRIGIPDYQMTAGVWMRIVLRELYGIRPQDISWVNGRTAGFSHMENVTSSLAPGIAVRRLQPGESMNELLQRGEIDGAYGDSASAAVEPSATVRRLPPELGRQVFRDFFAKTGTLPVNHVLLMQERLLEEDPALPTKLYETFERSKQMTYERARRASEAYFLFPELTFADAAAEFGADPYPPGLATNRRMVQTVIAELLDEGLIRQPVEVDPLFAPSIRNT